MKDITLLIMAAGMGSRYGGLKQLDSVGPNKETIIDYSVYDAIRVGFNKVVFVIRKEFQDVKKVAEDLTAERQITIQSSNWRDIVQERRKKIEVADSGFSLEFGE